MEHKNPMDRFTVVRLFDEAIDHETMQEQILDDGRSAWVAFMRTRENSLLKLFPGTRPTVYHCRPLSLAERRQLRALPEEDRWEAAFARAVTRVDNLVDQEGHPVESWVRDTKLQTKPLGDAALERFFSEADIIDVGSVIWIRSFLGRNSQVSYLAPPTSRHALLGLTLHRAAQKAKVSIEDKQRQEVLPLDLPTSSADGGEPGSAIVTE